MSQTARTDGRGYWDFRYDVYVCRETGEVLAEHEARFALERGYPAWEKPKPLHLTTLAEEVPINQVQLETQKFWRVRLAFPGPVGYTEAAACAWQLWREGSLFPKVKASE